MTALPILFVSAADVLLSRAGFKSITICQYQARCLDRA